ncbi:MAG: WYL domain-containing protein [Armatimonadetes bacterium]|nr:WYL domain-containing protein [Armatimonadota bacterium]
MIQTDLSRAAAAPDRQMCIRETVQEAMKHNDSVELGYHGSTRTVVPLKLQGPRVLCRRIDSNEMRAYRLTEIESALVNPREADPTEVVQTLKDAASHDHCVELRYRTEKNAVIQVMVEPYGLKWSSTGALLLEGVRADNDSFRTLRVDRIEHATETQQPFEPGREVPIEGHSLKPPQANAPVTLAVMS